MSASFKTDLELLCTLMQDWCISCMAGNKQKIEADRKKLLSMDSIQLGQGTWVLAWGNWAGFSVLYIQAKYTNIEYD